MARLETVPLVTENAKLAVIPVQVMAAERTPVAYRTAVAAADVLAAPGTVTCTKQAGGSCDAAEYNVKVVAANAYGRTTATAGNVAITTETTNLTVRAAFAAVTGATHYDIYCSTDVQPLWVGRITAAQRTSGIKLTAVGTTGAGGAAGAVDIEVPGTGLAAGTTAAVNTAYSLPAVIDCTGHDYIDFFITFTRTGDAVAPALVWVPYFYNATDGTYYAGTAVTMAYGGTSGSYGALKQRSLLQVRGNSGVAFVVQSIAGGTVTVGYALA